MEEEVTAYSWDDSMKLLAEANPQALVSFLLGDAIFEQELDREQRVYPIKSDLLYIVNWNHEQVVLHVEFQTYHDSNMLRRVWEYSALASIRTGLPVYSVVIYLVKDSGIVEPPYVMRLRNGLITHQLDFQNIKLWELPPEAIEQPGLSGLLPLLPLTKGDFKRDLVERMINGLEQAQRLDILWLGYAFSFLALALDGDQRWVKERFQPMLDIIKRTPVFQELREEALQEGRQEGIQKGHQEGRQEGRQEGIEQEKEHTILRFVELRFPTLLTLAKQQIQHKMSLEQLQIIIDKLYLSTTLEEIRAALLEGEQTD